MERGCQQSDSLGDGLPPTSTSIQDVNCAGAAYMLPIPRTLGVTRRGLMRCDARGR